jgi:hypothetical protein
MNLKNKDVLQKLREIQDKCLHKDVSNWIPYESRFVKMCMDCNKVIDKKSIE